MTGIVKKSFIEKMLVLFLVASAPLSASGSDLPKDFDSDDYRMPDKVYTQLLKQFESEAKRLNAGRKANWYRGGAEDNAPILFLSRYGFEAMAIAAARGDCQTAVSVFKVNRDWLEKSGVRFRAGGAYQFSERIDYVAGMMGQGQSGNSQSQSTQLKKQIISCLFNNGLGDDDAMWLATAYPGNTTDRYSNDPGLLLQTPNLRKETIERMDRIAIFHRATQSILSKASASSGIQTSQNYMEVYASAARTATKFGLPQLSEYYQAAANFEQASVSASMKQQQSDKFWADLTQIAGMVLQQMPGNKSTASQLITGMMVNGEDSVGGQQVLDAILEQAISGGAAGKGKRNTSGKCVDVDSGTARVLPDRYCEGTK